MDTYMYMHTQYQLTIINSCLNKTPGVQLYMYMYMHVHVLAATQHTFVLEV